MRDSKIGRYFNRIMAGEPYVLCSCEGAAKKAIVEKLVDSGMLKFDRSDLVEGQITRIRQARDIEKKFLNRDYGDRGLVICRILDSRNENFRLQKQYAEQYEVFNFYTRPEIEILHIIRQKEYSHFKKSGEKPSTYFKKKEGFRNNQYKSEKYINELYSDPVMLVQVIQEYNRICGQKEELNLYDLLTDEAIRIH